MTTYQDLKYLLIFLVISSIIYCKEENKTHSLEIAWTKRGKPKTTDQYIFTTNKKNGDSIYIYKDLSEEKLDFQFILSNNTFIHCFESDTILLELKGTKKVKFSNQEYLIYNLLSFQPGTDDGVINYFFTKEFGVINILNKAFMNIGKINFSNMPYKETIDYLNAELIIDSIFYLYNNFPPPPIIEGPK